MWKINTHWDFWQWEPFLGYSHKFSRISCYHQWCDRNNKSCMKKSACDCNTKHSNNNGGHSAVTSHRQTFLLIVILPPPSSRHSSDRPYLVALCDLYEPGDVMSDELKIRILGLSYSEKCTCLVIFGEVAVKTARPGCFGLGDDLITH